MTKLSVKQAQQKLVKYALTFPESAVDHPWGDEVERVRGKMFAAFGGDPAGAKELSTSVKLPVSADMALTLPRVEPRVMGCASQAGLRRGSRPARMSTSKP